MMKSIKDQGWRSSFSGFAVLLRKCLFSHYKRTLALDFLCGIILLVIILVSLALLNSVWQNLGKMMPTALQTAYGIMHDPGAVEGYKGAIDAIKGSLDLFIFGSWAIILTGSAISLLVYAFFQRRIFGLMATKKSSLSFLKFLLLNLVMLVFFMVCLFISLFILKSPANAVASVLLLLFFVLFVNNAYFAFHNTGKLWASLLKALRLVRLRSLALFIANVVVFVVCIELSLLLASVLPPPGLILVILVPLFYWPFGRIAIFCMNEVLWKDVS